MWIGQFLEQTIPVNISNDVRLTVSVYVVVTEQTVSVYVVAIEQTVSVYVVAIEQTV